MAATHTPGVAVAALQRGEPVRALCSGMLDLASRQPVTPETVFEAASLSKPLFAYAVLRLIDQGRLDPDVPLCDLLGAPLLGGDGREAMITARRVLSHSSGLPNWREKDQPLALLFDPGQRFGYSGEGYVYLQRVVERITGEDLQAYIQGALLSSLGLTSTAYTWQPTFERAYAQGHSQQGEPLAKNRPNEANAASSLHTTLSDYARFLEFILNPSQAPGLALSDGLYAQMLIPHTHIDADTGWGLGWGLKRCDGRWILWQWGDNRGFKHIIAASQEDGSGLVVLTNGENGWQICKEALRCAVDPQENIYHWLDSI